MSLLAQKNILMQKCHKCINYKNSNCKTVSTVKTEKGKWSTMCAGIWKTEQFKCKLQECEQISGA